MSSQITQTVLRTLVTYDGNTGLFVWNARGVEHFVDLHSCKVWNTKYAGHVCGSLDGDGYVKVCIKAKYYKAHRLAWLYVHGEWPQVIDHINGDRCDNRIENLRSVSAGDNNRHKRRPITNTSGVTGVCFHRSSGKWSARICPNNTGKHKSLGHFDNKADAVAARRAAELAHGYSSPSGGDA